MNLLLLGKNGQVGRELQRTLLPLGEVAAFGRDDEGLQNPVLLKERKPEIIVNDEAKVKLGIAILGTGFRQSLTE